MSDLRRVIDALAALRIATQVEEAASERRCQAEIRLAELSGTERRDKDTGFEADFNARDTIVRAALDGELIPRGEQSPDLEPHHVQALLSAIRDNGDDDLPEARSRLIASLQRETSA